MLATAAFSSIPMIFGDAFRNFDCGAVDQAGIHRRSGVGKRRSSVGTEPFARGCGLVCGEHHSEDDQCNDCA
jgi:hypothetical protein